MRNPMSRKGENGRVLIVGGSADYPGAVALAGISCLRMGADIVRVVAPAKCAWAVNCLCPDLITVKLRGMFLSCSHYGTVKKMLSHADVMLLGSGAGTRKDTMCLMKRLSLAGIAKVIDADALKCVDLRRLKNSLLTPHEAEFQVLCNNSRAAPESIGSLINTNVVLRKGPCDTVYTGGKKPIMLRTGNPGMTVAGTGDVLAGVCAGLLSQGLSLFDAAVYAAGIMGRAGRTLKAQLGYGFMASDFLRVLAIEKNKYSRLRRL